MQSSCRTVLYEILFYLEIAFFFRGEVARTRDRDTRRLIARGISRRLAPLGALFIFLTDNKGHIAGRYFYVSFLFSLFSARDTL